MKKDPKAIDVQSGDYDRSGFIFCSNCGEGRFCFQDMPIDRIFFIPCPVCREYFTLSFDRFSPQLTRLGNGIEKPQTCKPHAVPEECPCNYVDGHLGCHCPCHKPNEKVCTVCGHTGEGHITRFNEDGTVSLCVDKLPHKKPPQPTKCEHTTYCDQCVSPINVYTKQEIDERMKALLDALGKWFVAKKQFPDKHIEEGYALDLEDLRSRFL